MDYKIRIITLPMPLHMGMVNTYLIETSTGHLLIDTGSSHARKYLLAELESSGCMPNSLKLILLTHGDFDHIGNAAHLRSVFGTNIAMHPDDIEMAERGDMFVNRKKPNAIIKALLPIFSGFGKSERFAPGILVNDGYELMEYGLDAKVISLPGHSKGSIGILSPSGDLFCGDLFENIKGPALNSLMDDPVAAEASISKLKSMKITMLYPGHGRPFSMELLSTSEERAA